MHSFTLLGMVAETAVHVGEGRGDDAVDLPVARDSVTGLPILPGSSVKGALRHRVDALEPDEASRQRHDYLVKKLFGPASDPKEGAGALTFGEARLLLLPIRSGGAYPFRFVTAPMILDRLRRDLEQAGQLDAFASATLSSAELEPASQDRAIARENESDLGLEDLVYGSTCPKPGAIDALSGLLSKCTLGTIGSGQIAERLVIVDDRVFSFLCRHALPVRARNRLSAVKTVEGGGLWYEEALPADTVMTALLGIRGAVAGKADVGLQNDQATEKVLWDLLGPAGLLNDPLEDPPADLAAPCFLQIGGNETVGQGWMRLTQVALPAGGGT